LEKRTKGSSPKKKRASFTLGYKCATKEKKRKRKGRKSTNQRLKKSKRKNRKERKKNKYEKVPCSDQSKGLFLC